MSRSGWPGSFKAAFALRGKHFLAMPTLKAARLQTICEELFVRAGASADNARCLAEHLVLANVMGHDSHGVQMIPFYLRSIRKGELAPAAVPRVVKEDGALILVDGSHTFGQVAVHFATRQAIRKAKASKVALVGVVRHHHTGREGHFAEMAAEANVIALLVTGGFGADVRVLAPYGGMEPQFGGNPIALGFPGGAAAPVIVDIATAAIAIGKIVVARDKGVKVPPGSILDKHGRPSEDPKDFFDGGVALPFAGHKGSAMALAVNLLGGALVGSEDFLAPEDVTRSGLGPGGTLILAIDPGAFRSADSYAGTAERTLHRIQQTRPAPGFQKVMLPGEPERIVKAQRSEQGIPIPEPTWRDIHAAAAESNLELPPE